MKHIRQFFYLTIGCTFPGFWMLHASGLYAGWYAPLQNLFHTKSSGWPSFITAAFLYGIVIACFEVMYRLIKHSQP
ncbi:hypothetical protein [Desulfogranum japonicum]|uniref:hypothetical protein n=1 Tax=Desulfogranum japonicum TaxID=231447 RepID=UPI0012947D41|nr:hypothetical protein [Desulfogranum japonicum]